MGPTRLQQGALTVRPRAEALQERGQRQARLELDAFMAMAAGPRLMEGLASWLNVSYGATWLKLDANQEIIKACRQNLTPNTPTTN